MNRFRNTVSALALAVTGLAFTGLSSAQAALPDLGVDVGENVTDAATDLGATILIAVGVIFAIVIIGAGINWARKGLKSK